MKKIQLLCLLLLTAFSLAAQKDKNDEPSFTSTHRSTTLGFGVSGLLGMGGFSKDGDEENFALPVSLLFNKALTESVSFHWGPAVMYSRYRYAYGDVKGTSSQVLGGLNFGLNYHLGTTGKIDPYAGISAGVGYYHGLGSGTDKENSLDGSMPLLYGAKFGVNLYDKTDNAWTIELGYDYLSYLKVGYTFVKSK